MSKCGINRFRAGGRCGTGSGGGIQRGAGLTDNQLNKDFQSLLAQRAALDAQMATPVPTKIGAPTKVYATPALTQIMQEVPQSQPLTQREKIIARILDGDS